MIRFLLLCVMLVQAGTRPASKPVIENERVTVLEVSNLTPAQADDAVVVSFSGKAAWVPRGASPKIDGRSIIIDLKNHDQRPYANPTKYPLAFPRPGVKKLLDNDRVTVWDYTWAPGVPTPMHFHDKDVVVLFLDDGDLRSTTPEGKSDVARHTPGEIRFSRGNRAHSETLIRGKQRAIITELK